MKGLELVAELCNGKLEGATVDSEDISLIPKKLVCRDAEADTKTAGSCTLLAQAGAPPSPPPGPAWAGLCGSHSALAVSPVLRLRRVWLECGATAESKDSRGQRGGAEAARRAVLKKRKELPRGKVSARRSP